MKKAQFDRQGKSIASWEMLHGKSGRWGGQPRDAKGPDLAGMESLLWG